MPAGQKRSYHELSSNDISLPGFDAAGVADPDAQRYRAAESDLAEWMHVNESVTLGRIDQDVSRASAAVERAGIFRDAGVLGGADVSAMLQRFNQYKQQAAKLKSDVAEQLAKINDRLHEFWQRNSSATPPDTHEKIAEIKRRKTENAGGSGHVTPPDPNDPEIVDPPAYDPDKPTGMWTDMNEDKYQKLTRELNILDDQVSAADQNVLDQVGKVRAQQNKVDMLNRMPNRDENLLAQETQVLAQEEQELAALNKESAALHARYTMSTRLKQDLEQWRHDTLAKDIDLTLWDMKEFNNGYPLPKELDPPSIFPDDSWSRIVQADIEEHNVRAMEFLDLEMKKRNGIIQGILDRAAQKSQEMHDFWDLQFRGYRALMDKMIAADGEQEVMFGYWKKMRKTCGDKSGKEIENLKAEFASVSRDMEDLNRMFVLGTPEYEAAEAVVLQRWAKFNRPSYISWLKTTEDGKKFLATWEENEGLTLFGKMLFQLPVAGARGAYNLIKTGMLKILEAPFGPEPVVILSAAMDASFSAVGSVISFVLGFWGQVALAAGWLIWEAHDDGFSLLLVEDILQLIFLDLNTFQTNGQRVQMYPETSTEVNKKDIKSNLLNAFQRVQDLDMQENVETFNFWCKILVDTLRKTDRPNLPEFKEMAAPKVKFVLPGRYIDLQHHPFESDQYIAGCRKLEALYSDGKTPLLTRYEHGMVADAFIPPHPSDPKRYLRNWLGFPFYKNQRAWPDLHTGSPQIMNPYFSKSDMDPTMASLFETWVRAGTYGPLWNQSTKRHVQKEVETQNQAELEQFLRPRMDKCSIGPWTEMSQFFNTAEGRQLGTRLYVFSESQKEFDQEFRKPYPWTDKQKRASMLGKNEEDVIGTIQNVQYMFTNHRVMMFKDFYDVFDQIRTHKKTPSSTISYVGADVFNYQMKLRDSTAQEVQAANDYMKEIEEAKKFIQHRAGTLEQQHEELEYMWDLYSAEVTKSRTEWDFIYQYREQFMLQVYYLVMYYHRKDYTRIWEEWGKYRRHMNRPMDMSQMQRVKFMGKFAKLAYLEQSDMKAKTLENTLQEKFGGVAFNTLITTGKYGSWNGHAWARKIVNCLVVPMKNWDIPIEFGDIQIRVICFNKPATMVVAFKGSTFASDWMIDMDFTEGVLIEQDKHYDPQTAQDPKIKMLPFGGLKAHVEDLVGSPNIASIHRGFARVIEAVMPVLSEEIKSQMIQMNAIHGNCLENMMITGHSLGGALAQVSACFVPRLLAKPTTLGGVNVYLSKSSDEKKPVWCNPNVYTFSSPKVGNSKWADIYSKHVNESVHTYVTGDPVVLVPPMLVASKSYGKSAYGAFADEANYLLSVNQDMGAFMIFLMYVWHMAKLPDFINPGTISMKYKKGGIKALVTDAFETIQKSSDKLSCMRGPGVNFTVPPYGKGQPMESYLDENLQGTVAALLNGLLNGQTTKDFLKFHSLDNVLDWLEKVSVEDSDIVENISKWLPSWAQQGRIPPIPPTPKPNFPDFPRVVRRALYDPGNIIGYVRTNHVHKPGDIVDKGDIKDGSFTPSIV